MKAVVLYFLIGSAVSAPEALPNLRKIASTAVAKAPNTLASLDGLTAIVRTILPGKSDQYYLSKDWIGKVLVTDMMMNLTLAISPSLLLLLIVGFFSMSTPDEQCPVNEDQTSTSSANRGQKVNVPRTFGNNNYRGITLKQIRNRNKRESVAESKPGQRVRLFVRNHPDGPLKLIEEMRIKGGDNVKIKGVPKNESLLLKAMTAPPLTRTGKINQLREKNPLISQFLDINVDDENFGEKFLGISNTTKAPIFGPLPATLDSGTKVPPFQTFQTKPTLTLNLKQVLQNN